MEVDIDAALPGMKKKGRMHALRFISRLGQITYKAISFDGDNAVKKDVIARYLSADVQAADIQKQAQGSFGITPKNYKFEYFGVIPNGHASFHLFRLIPKAKRVGLFDGWLWLDTSTGLPVREQGNFVKSPSPFLKRVTFVRDFTFRDGLAIPSSIHSTVETWIAGSAVIEVKFYGVQKREFDQAALATAAGAQ